MCKVQTKDTTTHTRPCYNRQRHMLACAGGSEQLQAADKVCMLTTAKPYGLLQRPLETGHIFSLISDVLTCNSTDILRHALLVYKCLIHVLCVVCLYTQWMHMCSHYATSKRE